MKQNKPYDTIRRAIGSGSDWYEDFMPTVSFKIDGLSNSNNLNGNESQATTVYNIEVEIAGKQLYDFEKCYASPHDYTKTIRRNNKKIIKQGHHKNTFRYYLYEEKIRERYNSTCGHDDANLVSNWNNLEPQMNILKDAPEYEQNKNTVFYDCLEDGPYLIGSIDWEVYGKIIKIPVKGKADYEIIHNVTE